MRRNETDPVKSYTERSSGAAADAVSTRRVHDVMQVTKVDTVLDIMDDEAVAIKSYGQSAGATG